MIAIFDWIDFYWILVTLAIMGGLLCIPYVLGPILIYFTLKITGDPVLDEFSLDDAKLPRGVKKYVFPTLQEIEEDGFEVLGAYYLGSLVANVKAFTVLTGNRESMDMAMLVVSYLEEDGTTMVKQRHMEYFTKFTDGSSLATNNSEELSAFKRLRHKTLVALPWIPDARRLYQIHLASIDHFHPDAEKEWPIEDDPAEYLHCALVRELTDQLDTGYLYEDGQGDFRPTIKGAFIMTYKNLWPFTSLLKSRRRSQGEALLARLQA